MILIQTAVVFSVLMLVQSIDIEDLTLVKILLGNGKEEEDWIPTNFFQHIPKAQTLALEESSNSNRTEAPTPFTSTSTAISIFNPKDASISSNSNSIPNTACTSSSNVISLDMLPDKESYYCFKSLCRKSNPSKPIKEIPNEWFRPFVSAAAHCNLQGKYFSKFSKHMITKGLSGTNHKKIVMSFQVYSTEEKHVIWSMFICFLRLLSLDVDITPAQFDSESCILSIAKKRLQT
ncbi:hypothetical protein NECID01_1421 [Nematocida sp. AWRm77]|nr:hypothetical protein NECID01_1421 [Nematocida sp. AWRm77]